MKSGIEVRRDPLLIGSYTPTRGLQQPVCGRRATDGLAVVLPGLVWLGCIVTDPDVLRVHGAALIEAADWLENEQADAAP